MNKEQRTINNEQWLLFGSIGLAWGIMQVKENEISRRWQ